MQSSIKHLLKHFALVLKAKLNQLKPFVRFVFQPSTLLHPPINQFIKGLHTQTFFILLYASFSCPYNKFRNLFLFISYFPRKKRPRKRGLFFLAHRLLLHSKSVRIKGLQFIQAVREHLLPFFTLIHQTEQMYPTSIIFVIRFNNQGIFDSRLDDYAEAVVKSGQHGRQTTARKLAIHIIAGGYFAFGCSKKTIPIHTTTNNVADDVIGDPCTPIHLTPFSPSVASIVYEIIIAIADHRFQLFLDSRIIDRARRSDQVVYAAGGSQQLLVRPRTVIDRIVVAGRKGSQCSQKQQ